MADVHRLPGPLADAWDWQLRAACRGVDATLFFNDEGEPAASRIQREAAAKKLCRQCPVLTQCQAHALQVHEPYGIWGGLSRSEREQIWRNHNRRLTIIGSTPTEHPT